MRLSRIVVPATLLILLSAPSALAQSPATNPAPEPSSGSSTNAAAGAPNAAAATGGGDWSTDPSDTTEHPDQKYYFIGARYRWNLIPKFMVNLFVDEGASFHSNSFGFELDMRKENHSTMPWLTYAEYGSGDILFLQKNKDANDPGNWTYVNSSLKAIYLGLDELWSAPIANHLEFEYGFGVGIGFVFGDLVNNWVYRSATGEYTSSDGQRFSPCKTVNDGAGCSPANHQNTTDPPKVWATNGGNPYVEKMWFSGGSIPNIFPHIAFPQIGLRYKPVKQFVARFGLGFSLTGFWFGISGDYGLERPEKKEPKGARIPPLGGAF
jgi:hypothetical protein